MEFSACKSKINLLFYDQHSYKLLNIEFSSLIENVKSLQLYFLKINNRHIKSLMIVMLDFAAITIYVLHTQIGYLNYVFETVNDFYRTIIKLHNLIHISVDS